MKLDSPCTLYLQRLAPSGRTSVASQLNQVKKLLNWQGDIHQQPFHLLKFAEIEHIKQQMLVQGKSPRTINLAINSLKSVVKTGFLMELTPEKTWLKVQAVKSLKTTSNDKGKALTSTQVQLLLTECACDKRPIGKRDVAILAIFLATGARRFELANFMLADFDPKQNSLRINLGKGRKSRCQFLPTWALPHLKTWLEVRGNPAGFLFNPFRCRIPDPDHQLSVSAIYRAVKKRSEMALANASAPHDLRRTFITQLLRQNIDLSTASKLAGHASLATTQIYDKRGDDITRDAAQALLFKE